MPELKDLKMIPNFMIQDDPLTTRTKDAGTPQHFNVYIKVNQVIRIKRSTSNKVISHE